MSTTSPPVRCPRRQFLLTLGAAVAGLSCGPRTGFIECAAEPRWGVRAPGGGLVPGEVCTLWGWGELHSARARVFRPKDVEELRALLAAIQDDPAPRRVTFRAGGQSLDAQALGDDLVICLDGAGFVEISGPRYDASLGAHVMTAGAGTTWREIVRVASEAGFMPYSVVTTGAATVGGTLSADCLSRFSPVSGREGEHVVSFELVTARGERLTCSRKANEHPELFQAALGGYGWLGAITRATFRVMKVRPKGTTAPVRAVSYSEKADEASIDWDSFLGRLLAQTQRERQYFQDERDGVEGEPPLEIGPLQKTVPRGRGGRAASALPPNEKWQAVSGFGWPSGRGLTMALVFSRYAATDEPLDPFPLYEANWLLKAVGQLMFLPTLTLLGQDAAWLLFNEGRSVDALETFCFFMETQFAPAKAQWHERGQRLGVVQQTFVIPLGDPESLSSQVRPTKYFLETMAERFRADDLHPIIVDVLFLPADDFLLSANRGLAGFAVTVVFAILDAHEPGSYFHNWVAPRLSDLSTICQELGGRIHLVKNVVAEPITLEKMYGAAGRELAALKDLHDPRGTLKNEFYERLFGKTPEEVK